MKQVFHSCLFLLALLLGSFTRHLPQEKEQKIRIETEHGTMVAVLYNQTPLHRDNFIKNVKNSVYNDLLFHRVINEFMIQGGDPESKGAKEGVVLGNGGMGYTIPAEFNPALFHKKGALCAARTGDDKNPKRESSACQFYIVHGRVYTEKLMTMLEERFNNQKRNEIFNKMLQLPEYSAHLKRVTEAKAANDVAKIQEVYNELLPLINKELEAIGLFKFSTEQIKAYTTDGGCPQLDGNYTVFGQVVEGLDVIDKIAMQKGDANNRPLTDIKMKITLVE